jgi:hypothetical protein
MDGDRVRLQALDSDVTQVEDLGARPLKVHSVGALDSCSSMQVDSGLPNRITTVGDRLVSH